MCSSIHAYSVLGEVCVTTTRQPSVAMSIFRGESVHVVAQSCGVGRVTEAGAAALAEDAELRLRHVVQVHTPVMCVIVLCVCTVWCRQWAGVLLPVRC